MTDGDARLLHAGRGERRKADDVARRVDVGHRGPIVRVDLHEGAHVRAHAERLETERRRVADAAAGDEHEIGGDERSITQGDRGAATRHLDAPDLGVAIDGDVEACRHRATQRVAHLTVEVGDQATPLVDHGDARAERGEGAGVLAADHAAADDDHRRGNPLEGEE